MENKLTTLGITIVILCCLLTGAVWIETASLKILGTAGDLFTCWDNNVFYSESVVKTDDMTQAYLESQEYRNAIYNSDDDIVRIYSNSNIVVKLAVLLLSISWIVGVPIIIVYTIVIRIKTKIANREKLERIIWHTKRAIKRQRLENCENNY